METNLKQTERSHVCVPHAQTHASNAHLQRNVNTLAAHHDASVTKQFFDNDSKGIQLNLPI